MKAFHRDMPERPIYALDLRNHGDSPQATPMTYEAMVKDVDKFVEDRNLRNVTLVGHSMSVFFYLTFLYVSYATILAGEERSLWRMHCQSQDICRVSL